MESFHARGTGGPKDGVFSNYERQVDVFYKGSLIF